ncbi:UNVERIFIED_CONTAM: hypothetical protein FKN15_016904 [Acipenser sinensis]
MFGSTNSRASLDPAATQHGVRVGYRPLLTQLETVSVLLLLFRPCKSGHLGPRLSLHSRAQMATCHQTHTHTCRSSALPQHANI